MLLADVRIIVSIKRLRPLFWRISMKKLISALLCFVLLLSSVCVASAGFDKSEYNGYPVIVVAGYSSSAQYRIDENGNKVHVWGIDMNEIIAAVFKNVGDFVVAVSNAGSPGEEIFYIFEKNYEKHLFICKKIGYNKETKQQKYAENRIGRNERCACANRHSLQSW